MDWPIEAGRITRPDLNFHIKTCPTEVEAARGSPTGRLQGAQGRDKDERGRAASAQILGTG